MKVDEYEEKVLDRITDYKADFFDLMLHLSEMSTSDQQAAVEGLVQKIYNHQ